MITLVIGGARSGKSRQAQLACGSRDAVFIATGCGDGDPEMARRIAKHRASRPSTWTTVEEPLDVAGAVGRAGPECTVVIVDCVTLWMSNLMWAHRTLDDDALEEAVLRAVDELIMRGQGRDLIIVSNEVGTSVVPDTPLGRRFRDLQGLANQRIAEAAERVFFMVAGIAITVK